ncbi:TPA: hypothetical protein EYO63_17490 [Candidatus Poribacteria bacterium]|nr:hypothetical protein [Candidatus Poribacteria bacterium]
MSLGEAMRFGFLLILFSLLIAFNQASTAFIDLSIIYPETGFTTNNQKLAIKGNVTSKIPTEIIVSANTPGGIKSLADLQHPIQSVTMDLDSTQLLSGILIQPVPNSQFPLGPRAIQLAFSQDGSDFSIPKKFNVPSSLSTEFHRVFVAFSLPINSRFIEVTMVEGWQSNQIAVQSIEFLNTDERVIQASIESIAISLDLMSRDNQDFSMEVLLRPGENHITLIATALPPQILNPTLAVDQHTISLVYQPELLPEAAEDGYFLLSDGTQTEVSIPVDSFNQQIKKLQFWRIQPTEIPPFSYLSNTMIAANTSPVVVYRFVAFLQTNFSVESSNFLPYQPPDLVVDGLFDAPSTWITNLTPLPIDLTIDLGRQYTIGRITVHANMDQEKSFGPQNVIIYTSGDDQQFIEILEFDDFLDHITNIDLEIRPKARYVRFKIIESKQANNIQINEIEFFDASSSKIVPFTEFNHLILNKPVFLRISYDSFDLLNAGVDPLMSKNMRIFSWDEPAQEWQIAGGSVNQNLQMVEIELNYIAQFAVFQTVLSETSTAWTFNPFSPDGNGVADTTHLTITAPNILELGQRELTIEIFDLNSKLVRTLIDRTVINTNSVSVEWDGRNRTGEIVNIGPYLYQVRIGTKISNGVIVIGK